MATELTEYALTKQVYGTQAPGRPLDFAVHQSLALGNVYTVAGASTRNLSVVPAEDCRYNFSVGNGSQADPTAPTTSCPLLKAGTVYNFEVTKGTKVRFAAFMAVLG